METDFVIADTDPKVVNQEIWNQLNQISSYTNRLLLYRYHLLLFNLIKSGHVRMVDLAKDSGYSKTRLYKIIDEFEKKELERQNETV